MSAAAVPIISGGLGLLGLLQSNKQSDAARHSQEDANARALDLQNQMLDFAKQRYGDFSTRYFPWLDQIGAMAHSYDPMQADRAAAKYASDTTGQALETALRNLNASTVAGGGSPNGDSEYRFQTQGTTDRITDPLRAFLANQASTGPQRKLAFYQAAMGAPPGDISGAFDSASQMNAQMANMFGQQAMMAGQAGAGSMDLLGNALQQLLGGGSFRGSGAKSGGNPFYNINGAPYGQEGGVGWL